MKQVLLSLLLCVFISFAEAKHNKQFFYLIVKIEAKRDDLGERYYRIVPEEGNTNAAGINALVKYNSRQKNARTLTFYSGATDTAQTFFNYFKSISGALEYLDTWGWRLLTIGKDVYGTDGSTSTETSYYLRKEL